MTQSAFPDLLSVDPNGLQLAEILNNWAAASASMHSGSLRPDYAVKGMLWHDSAASDFLMNVFDGAADAALFQMDTASSVVRTNFDADRDSYIVADIDDTHRVVQGGSETFRLTPMGLCVGSGNPAVGLDLGGKADAIRLPSGTEAQRPSTVSGAYIRFNQETGNVEVWTQSDGWFDVKRSMPPGLLVYYGGDVAPTGMYPALGADMTRAAYPELFDAWGTKYGVGDGVATFGTPDARDLHIEGAGVVPVGDYLAQSIQLHNHTNDPPSSRFYTNTTPNHDHPIFDQSGASGGNGNGQRWVAVTIASNATGAKRTDPAGAHNHFVDVNLPAFLSGDTGSAKTRPASLTCLTCFTY